MSINVNKQVKGVTYNGVPLVLSGGTGVDLVPVEGFVPKTVDGEGYITSGTLYGSYVPRGVLSCELVDYYKNLVAVNLPESLTKVEMHAFYGCESLALTSLPDSITEIDDYAFKGCKSLALTSLPNSLTTIGDYAFDRCFNITITSIPASVTSIGARAFSICNLTSVTFEGTPTSIASYAFEDYDNLTTINVPWGWGDVSGAPWGATKATINYNYKG